MQKLMSEQNSKSVVKVVGVGGFGIKAIKQLIGQSLENLEYLCVYSNVNELAGIYECPSIEIEDETSLKQIESKEYNFLVDNLKGVDILFIAVGMGGTTGTCVAPAVAEIAGSMGILTFAVVTTPFQFEGSKINLAAENGLRDLNALVDHSISIPNESYFKYLDKGVSLLDIYKLINNCFVDSIKQIILFVNGHDSVKEGADQLRKFILTGDINFIGVKHEEEPIMSNSQKTNSIGETVAVGVGAAIGAGTGAAIGVTTVAAAAEAAVVATLATAATTTATGAAVTTGALATAGGGAIAAGGTGMVGGVATIVSAAATSATVPIIGWAVGGAIVLGVGAWGIYKLAIGKSK
jgi:hypothetical protein